MMRCLFCVVAFLTLAYARKYCCMPKQWEGYEGLVMGTARRGEEPRITEMGMKVAYDGTKKMIAVFMEEHGMKVKIVQDYAKNVQYSIRNNTCTKSRLGPFNDGCIPDAATRVGPFYMGAGDQTLEVYSYTGTVEKMKYSITATSRGCIPVGEMIYGRGKEQGTMITVGFANITPGIKDPSVFFIPDSCNRAHLMNVNLQEKKLPSIFSV